MRSFPIVCSRSVANYVATILILRYVGKFDTIRLRVFIFNLVNIVSVSNVSINGNDGRRSDIGNYDNNSTQSDASNCSIIRNQADICVNSIVSSEALQPFTLAISNTHVTMKVVSNT